LFEFKFELATENENLDIVHTYTVYGVTVLVDFEY